jgi:membrane protein YdbS with pleckstrin-like domain
MDEPIVVKKHPIVIIRNLVLLQFLATGAYFTAGVLANYGELYARITVSEIISYEIAKFVFIILGELFVIGYIFLRWFLSSYTIYPDRVILEWGLLVRKRREVPLAPPVTISYEIGPVGRIFKYGSLLLRGRGMEKPVMLSYVQNPEASRRKLLSFVGGRNYRETVEEIRDIEELLRRREHERLEFKTTFRWDMQEGRINRGLEKAVMKTIAAFLNSEGGHVVLGVGDSGELHGMEYDYLSLNRHDADGFENHFTNVFKEMLGPEFRRFVKLSFHNHSDKEVCVIRVAPAHKPVYAKLGGEESFFIRTGNSTTELKPSELAPYVRSRWRRI